MNLAVSTVSYAAPEQLTGHDIDGRADQYALTGTAFHLLTGAPPYENSTPVAVISAHRTAPPPSSARSAPVSHASAGCWPPPWPKRLKNALWAASSSPQPSAKRSEVVADWVDP